MLSPREIEILRRVAVGSTNKEIARHFSISEDTAKAHIKSILAKLHATDRTQAVTIALKRSIFEI
jgi:DNA-binding NarL/FixJ family response regulator